MRVCAADGSKKDHRLALENAGCGSCSQPLLYVYDNKCILRVLDADSDLLRNPWKRTNALHKDTFQKWLHGIFVDPELNKNKSAAKKDAMLFRPGDVLLMFDGRSPKAHNNMTSELNKCLKGSEKSLNLPARPWTVVRRMYHGQEFRSGGGLYSKRSTSLNAKSAEPLENLLVLKSKDKQATRDGAAESFGGSGHIADNNMRAWADIGMKSEESQKLTSVSFSTYTSMLGPRASEPGDGKEANDETDSEAENEEQPKDAGIFISPWESNVEDIALSYRLYRPENGQVVILTPGSGESALAAVRERMRAIVFCETETQKQAIFQMLLLKITFAMISGNSPGFSLGRRVLSRAASLNGQEPAPPQVQAAPPPEEVATDSEQQKAAVDDASDGSGWQDSENEES